jgi:hypothetical protein
MTVEVCLLRAGTTSAALLDMIVCVINVMDVYQWEGSSFNVSEGKHGMTLEGAEAFHLMNARLTKQCGITPSIKCPCNHVEYDPSRYKVRHRHLSRHLIS